VSHDSAFRPASAQRSPRIIAPAGRQFCVSKIDARPAGGRSDSGIPPPASAEPPPAPRQLPRPRTLAKLATGRTPSRFVSTPPRPIHRWKAPGETVTTVILHGGVLYYNLSYGGYTPKSQLAAINPLFLPETLIYLDIVFIMYDLVPFGRRQRSEVRLQQRSASPN
jgi:hypothetical protein